MLTSVNNVHSQKIALKLHRLLHAGDFECYSGYPFNGHGPPLLELAYSGSVSSRLAFNLCAGFGSILK